MLTILAFSTVLAGQEPPPPPPSPEVRARHVFVSTNGSSGLDKDGDGQVTREEFAAPLNDAFAEMDKDGNGRLSTEELASSGPIGGPGGARVIIDGGPGEAFHIREDGGAGERRIEVRRRGAPAAAGAGEVMIFDRPGGPGEPLTFTRREGGPGESRVEIRRVGGPDGPGDLDKDGDGKVSEAEFTAPLRDAFARMDADRSGFIEEGERSQDGDVRVFTHRIERRDTRED